MAASDRPGGLTALALFNLAFAIGELFEGIGRLVQRYNTLRYIEGDLPGWMLGGRNRGPFDSGLSGEERFQMLSDVGPDTLLFLGVLSLGAALLLALSVRGLLNSRRLMGRWLATLGAAAMITAALLTVSWFPGVLLHDSGLALVRGIFYPLLLLAMVHTTFAKDLVR
ncbi:MAG TPA: hypothetical protein EYN79_03645 [Planctomycetes bacterium]|nr:hypothetical protein [Planctomycetota bacterium]HIN81161.1 hypothetical protein [Planctomycetota bacterium]